MTICQIPGCQAHYGCRLRAKGIQANPITTTPTATRRYVPGKERVHNSWERGVASEPRPGGARMPIIKPDGTPVRMKEAAQRRHEFDAVRARRRAQGAN